MANPDADMPAESEQADGLLAVPWPERLPWRAASALLVVAGALLGVGAV